MKRLTVRQGEGMWTLLAHGVTNRKALSRLASYEDTGLEPEEIKKRLCQWGLAFSPFPDYSITDIALRQWAEADKDGRAVILPCKVGDTVYEIEPLWLATICDIDAKCRSCKDFYEGGMGDTPCCLRESRACLTISEKTATLSMIAEWMEKENFGKTVFLTHSEAVAALEGRQAWVEKGRGCPEWTSGGG